MIPAQNAKMKELSHNEITTLGVRRSPGGFLHYQFQESEGIPTMLVISHLPKCV